MPARNGVSLDNNETVDRAGRNANARVRPSGEVAADFVWIARHSPGATTTPLCGFV
jgi:hypothetical protein